MIIMHITTEDAWQNACQQGVYEEDSLSGEGFIHCCFPHQLESVLNDWFPDRSGLLILKVETDLLTSDYRCENLEGGNELFPHVYGPIALSAVIEHFPVK